MVGLEHILTLAVALAGSAGFWSFVSMKEKTRRETATEYQNTLNTHVDRFANKLEEKTSEIEGLLKEIAELRSDLSAAKVNITHLENLLRTR